MRIVFEGIWGSTVDYLLEEIIKNQDLPYDRVKVCMPPPPFNGIRGWTYALTENMRLWREYDEHPGEIVLYQHSVWSSYAFARGTVGDTQLDKDEINLFREMTDGIAEVHDLPDLIVYCHTFPEVASKKLEEQGSVCAEITEQSLSNTSFAMVEWLDEMYRKGVKVVELVPPYKEDIEPWYRSSVKTLQKVVNNFGDNDGSTDR